MIGLGSTDKHRNLRPGNSQLSPERVQPSRGQNRGNSSFPQWQRMVSTSCGLAAGTKGRVIASNSAALASERTRDFGVCFSLKQCLLTSPTVFQLGLVNYSLGKLENMSSIQSVLQTTIFRENNKGKKKKTKVKRKKGEVLPKILLKLPKANMRGRLHCQSCERAALVGDERGHVI